nr:hypothetical protein [Indioceanicola profundi]
MRKACSSVLSRRHLHAVQQKGDSQEGDRQEHHPDCRPDRPGRKSVRPMEGGGEAEREEEENAGAEYHHPAQIGRIVNEGQRQSRRCAPADQPDQQGGQQRADEQIPQERQGRHLWPVRQRDAGIEQLPHYLECRAAGKVRRLAGQGLVSGHQRQRRQVPDGHGQQKRPGLAADQDGMALPLAEHDQQES